ncbi:unnamed protein product, partial [Mesorhabditis spiculigera]
MIPDFPIPEEIELLHSKPSRPVFERYSLKWVPEALRHHASLSTQSSQASIELKKEAPTPTPPKSTHFHLRKSLKKWAHRKETTSSGVSHIKPQTFQALNMLATISTHFVQKL